MAGADERTAPNLTSPQLQWLTETNFIAGLVKQLRSEGSSDASSNARTVLVGVARSPLSAPLLQPLLDPSFFQPLLDSAFAAPVAVQVCLAAPRLLWMAQHLLDHSCAVTVELSCQEYRVPEVAKRGRNFGEQWGSEIMRIYATRYC